MKYSPETGGFVGVGVKWGSKPIVAYNPLTYNPHGLIIIRIEVIPLNDITKAVGTQIKMLRVSAGLSQEKLAFIAGIDRTYLASVESGKRNIAIVNLSKIVTALNISLAQFFDNHIIQAVEREQANGTLREQKN